MMIEAVNSFLMNHWTLMYALFMYTIGYIHGYYSRKKDDLNGAF